MVATVQSILRDHFPSFRAARRLPPYILKAAHALMRCRTAVYGGHVQRSRRVTWRVCGAIPANIGPVRSARPCRRSAGSSARGVGC